MVPWHSLLSLLRFFEVNTKQTSNLTLADQTLNTVRPIKILTKPSTAAEPSVLFNSQTPLVSPELESIGKARRIDNTLCIFNTPPTPQGDFDTPIPFSSECLESLYRFNSHPTHTCWDCKTWTSTYPNQNAWPGWEEYMAHQLQVNRYTFGYELHRFHTSIFSIGLSHVFIVMFEHQCHQKTKMLPVLGTLLPLTVPAVFAKVFMSQLDLYTTTSCLWYDQLVHTLFTRRSGALTQRTHIIGVSIHVHSHNPTIPKLWTYSITTCTHPEVVSWLFICHRL